MKLANLHFTDFYSLLAYNHPSECSSALIITQLHSLYSIVCVFRSASDQLTPQNCTLNILHTILHACGLPIQTYHLLLISASHMQFLSRAVLLQLIYFMKSCKLCKSQQPEIDGCPAIYIYNYIYEQVQDHYVQHFLPHVLKYISFKFIDILLLKQDA